MLRVRTTKTASFSTAVQVVRYEGKRTVVVKHVGSSKSNEEILLLKKTASRFIETYTGQQRLPNLEQSNPTTAVLQLDKCEYLGAHYTFIYEAITRMFVFLGFDQYNKLLLDLVLIRIIAPSSKLESIALLKELFGIKWQETNMYRSLPGFALQKEVVEKAVIAFAKKHYTFDFSIVFYDVTTLYFESFKEDTDTTDEKGEIIRKGLRRNGFSKDNKSNQPQIVIGLIVTREGFPVSYDVFAGNTFEGKTFIPSITKFTNTHAVKTLTVVADAAMISFENIEELKKNNMSYIVGARMASLKPEQIKQISTELTGQTQDLKELTKRDSSSMRIETERGLLVCDFSLKRYRKDKREMEKQIAKAEKLLQENEGVRRTKFLMSKDKKKTEQILNTNLVAKTKLLLGVKGYYSNLPHETNKTIIDHYHNLWHVEKAFRIAKSDLAMRPIYHFKKQTIEAHILICFMSLAVCKYMELKTEKSTKRIIKLLKSITEASILNKLTGEIIVMRQKLPEEVEQLWKTLEKS